MWFSKVPLRESSSSCFFSGSWDGKTKFRLIVPDLYVIANGYNAREVAANLSRELEREWKESKRANRYWKLLPFVSEPRNIKGCTGPIRSSSKTAKGIARDMVTWYCDRLYEVIPERYLREAEDTRDREWAAWEYANGPGYIWPWGMGSTCEPMPPAEPFPEFKEYTETKLAYQQWSAEQGLPEPEKRIPDHRDPQYQAFEMQRAKKREEGKATTKPLSAEDASKYLWKNEDQQTDLLDFLSTEETRDAKERINNELPQVTVSIFETIKRNSDAFLLGFTHGFGVSAINEALSLAKLVLEILGSVLQLPHLVWNIAELCRDLVCFALYNAFDLSLFKPGHDRARSILSALEASLKALRAELPEKLRLLVDQLLTELGSIDDLLLAARYFDAGETLGRILWDLLSILAAGYGAAKAVGVGLTRISPRVAKALGGGAKATDEIGEGLAKGADAPKTAEAKRQDEVKGPDNISDKPDTVDTNASLRENDVADSPETQKPDLDLETIKKETGLSAKELEHYQKLWGEFFPDWVERYKRLQADPVPAKYESFFAEKGINHILLGDEPNLGGHLYPPGPDRKRGYKTSFPKEWSTEQIIRNIVEISDDPTLKLMQETGPTGSLVTKTGKPARFSVVGKRGGIEIKVILEPSGRGIVSAFPVQ